MRLISQEGELGIAAAKSQYDDFQLLADDDWLRRAAIETCNLIDQLDAIDSSETWYWHTSHQSFCLSRAPQPPRLVIRITSMGGGHNSANDSMPKADIGSFEICYKMKPADEPWPDAWVHLHAHSVPDAVSALKIALLRCAEEDGHFFLVW